MKQPSTPPPPVMCNWCGANLEHEEHYPNCKGVAPPPAHAELVGRLRDEASAIRRALEPKPTERMLRIAGELDEAANALSVRDFAPAGEIKHWSEPR